MFQFGLFASHLPHLIIAAAYMIYFGAYTYQSNDDAECEINQNRTIENYSYERGLINSHIAFYDVYGEAFSTGYTCPKLDPYAQKIKEIYYFFEHSLHDLHQRSYVFSRPPPTC